jgi:hypothetical protein
MAPETTGVAPQARDNLASKLTKPGRAAARAATVSVRRPHNETSRPLGGSNRQQRDVLS